MRSRTQLVQSRLSTTAYPFYRGVVLSSFIGLAIALAAFHSPGEMSVDSVMALYSAMKGAAQGWGPTFMSATLAWLGGGAIGTSLFVALICVLTYGCFAIVLTDRHASKVPVWQIVLAILLALNPLFMFYVGIIWKDVMQATVAMVAATLLLLATYRHGRSRFALLGLAAVITGILVPIRQQGVLLAVPIATAIGWLTVIELWQRTLPRLMGTVVCVGFVFGCSFGFYALSAATVAPQANGPVSVGIFTIQAYDIAGMIKDAKPGDPSAWSHAPLDVQESIKAHYSSERIDTIWHLENVRNYFNGLSAEQYMAVWFHGIEHDPRAYVKSRFRAFGSLLGLHNITGCVPAFAGIGALPEQVAQLGLENGMNERAHILGRAVVALYPTPVFRNWFYGFLLLVASGWILFGTRGDVRVGAGGIAIAAWLYLLSFLPTTIACDVRYLYPVASLSTALCLFLLTHTMLIQGKASRDAD